jgi:hypothetical protein
MFNLKNKFALLLVATLVGCGGGGSSSSPQTPVGPVISATLYDTSYKNFKSYPINTLTYPSYRGSSGYDPIVFGYGDFNKAGELGVFIAYTNHFTSMTTATINSDTKYLSDFTFWSINSDKTMTMVSSVKGCLNPRKAVVADFNKDGIPDVFVACHGHDVLPFAGEKSKLVLSKSRGVYTTTDIGNMDFGHSASAADINNDGYPDIVVATGTDVYFYINQGNGSFVKDTTKIIPGNYNLDQYYSVELIDINNDGKIDLLVGGNDFLIEHPTRILYGDGSTFGKTSKIIPTVKGSGTVLDFTYIESKKQLFLGRVYDPTNTAGSYTGWTLQGFNLDTGISSIIASMLGQWVFWFIPATVDNKTGVSAFPLYYTSNFYSF